MRLSSLSIFFPALNDAQVLPKLIKKADRVAKKLTTTYEIIVVNDGSTDNTAHVVQKLQKTYKALRVITHSTNRGYGAALQSGFKNARFDWIFYTDGDGQYDPKELLRLARLVTPDIDVVNGFKIRRADSLIRVIAGRIYNTLMHLVHPLPIADVDCDFRLIRGSVLRKISLKSTTGAICVELINKLAQHGARFAQIGVSHYPRQFGTSQFFRPQRLWETMTSLFKRDVFS